MRGRRQEGCAASNTPEQVARAICDSEAFMWLMVGASHPEAHIQTLRGAWAAYRESGGGYGAPSPDPHTPKRGTP